MFTIIYKETEKNISFKLSYTESLFVGQ